MLSNVTRITRALGLGLMIAVFSVGCGIPRNTNLPRVTSSAGTAQKQEVPTEKLAEIIDSAVKVLGAEAFSPTVESVELSGIKFLGT